MQPVPHNVRPRVVRHLASPGVVLTVSAAVVWWALATWRDGTTFHLAPAVVVAAWAVADRLRGERPLGRAQAAGRLAVGTVAALVVTLVLQLTGRLDGPVLVGGNGFGETMLVAGAALVLTWPAVTAHGRGR